MGRLTERESFKDWLSEMPASTRLTVQALQSIVQSYRCVMFSTTWCPWCDRSQEYIRSQNGGVNCRKVDLDVPPVELASVEKVGATLAALTGQSSVPNMFIARKHIGGYEQLVNTADKCRAGTLPDEHRDICDFLSPPANR
mmetsp:Transcript_65744/g.177578  ORF Transcript_65744/g.177578 Transcript_65744/m.177578 type:complete len:141 (+) Transcript_65744:28-450(+)